jgi:hypothetical protein
LIARLKRRKKEHLGRLRLPHGDYSMITFDGSKSKNLKNIVSTLVN